MSDKVSFTDTNYSVFLAGESVSESIYKDFVTCVMIVFCVYISQGSTFWTFITGSMFMLFMFARISRLVTTRQKRFRNKKDLQAWVDSLDDDKVV